MSAVYVVATWLSLLYILIAGCQAISVTKAARTVNRLYNELGLAEWHRVSKRDTQHVSEQRGGSNLMSLTLLKYVNTFCTQDNAVPDGDVGLGHFLEAVSHLESANELLNGTLHSEFAKIQNTGGDENALTSVSLMMESNLNSSVYGMYCAYAKLLPIIIHLRYKGSDALKDDECTSLERLSLIAEYHDNHQQLDSLRGISAFTFPVFKSDLQCLLDDIAENAEAMKKEKLKLISSQPGTLSYRYAKWALIRQSLNLADLTSDVRRLRKALNDMIHYATKYPKLNGTSKRSIHDVQCSGMSCVVRARVVRALPVGEVFQVMRRAQADSDDDAAETAVERCDKLHNRVATLKEEAFNPEGAQFLNQLAHSGHALLDDVICLTKAFNRVKGQEDDTNPEELADLREDVGLFGNAAAKYDSIAAELARLVNADHDTSAQSFAEALMEKLNLSDI